MRVSASQMAGKIACATLVLGGVVLLLGASVNVEAQAPKPADASKSESDEARTYEAIKRRDMLSFDFMLAHPEGKLAEGVSAEEAHQIEATVKGGCEAIIKMQQADGLYDIYNMGTTGSIYTCGAHAMALWTVLAGGRATTDPSVKLGLSAMLSLAEKRPPQPKPADPNAPVLAARKSGVDGLYSYEGSLVLIALHSLATTRAKEAEEAAAKKRDKNNDGVPDKPAPKKPKETRSAEEVQQAAAELQKRLLPEELRIAKALLVTMVKRQAGDGQWGYNDAVGANGDNSNCHWAMLGLLAAFRLGLGAPPAAVLDKTEKFWISAQADDGPAVTLLFRENTLETKKPGKTSGTRKPRQLQAKARGFKYVIGASSKPVVGEKDDSTLTMSSAAVICMSIVRYLKLGGAGTALGNPAVEKLDRALLDAMAWMSWTLDHQPPVAVKSAAEIAAEEAAKKDPPKKDDPKKPAGGAEKKETPDEKAKREQAEAREKSIAASRLVSRAYPATSYNGAYAMLAVERSGILAGCDFFGSCEWYPVGARYLLTRLAGLRPPEEQKDEEDPNGGGRRSPPLPAAPPAVNPDLCMELLFLKGYLDKAPQTAPGPTITGGKRKDAAKGDGSKGEAPKGETPSGEKPTGGEPEKKAE
jgi:hypothetical protein